MISAVVPVDVGFSWATVPQHWVAVRANAEPIIKLDLQRRINRCIPEVNAPKGRKFESGHLPDHFGDGFDDA
jgi:hypothetical protein